MRGRWTRDAQKAFVVVHAFAQIFTRYNFVGSRSLLKLALALPAGACLPAQSEFSRPSPAVSCSVSHLPFSASCRFLTGKFMVFPAFHIPLAQNSVPPNSALRFLSSVLRPSPSLPRLGAAAFVAAAYVGTLLDLTDAAWATSLVPVQLRNPSCCRRIFRTGHPAVDVFFSLVFLTCE